MEVDEEQLFKWLLWLYLLEFGFMVTSLEPGFLDFDNLPDTNFTCVGKVIGGYYADLETSCQMFHVCTIGQLEEPMDIRFLCLNGTVFDQETRVCERIDEVDCTISEQFYSLNLELYGNTQPPILEEDEDDEIDEVEEEIEDDDEETEPPETLKHSSSTTTSTTTTPRPTKPKTTRPSFIITTTPKHITTNLPDLLLQSHHFPVSTNSADIRFNPEEINISLNAGSPPNIRTKPISFQQQSFSDSNKRVIVTTHTTIYKSGNKQPVLPTPNTNKLQQQEQQHHHNHQQQLEEELEIEIQTQRPKSIVSYGLTHDKPTPKQSHQQKELQQQLQQQQLQAAQVQEQLKQQREQVHHQLQQQQALHAAPQQLHQQQQRQPIEDSYSFSGYQTERSIDYQTELPRHNYQYRSNIPNFRPSASDYHQQKIDYKPSTYRSIYHPTTNNPLKLQYNRGPTTYRNHAYISPLKPSQPYYHRTDKPPRIQLPLPLLPTISPLTFSSPAPFSLNRHHVENKRYTDHHQAPRIVISASASVSDASGRKFNYSLGTIGDTRFFGQAPNSYDDYKEGDVGLDPFYHDVPKLRRHKRSASKNNLQLKKGDVVATKQFKIGVMDKPQTARHKRQTQIKEREAIDVLKFLFTWYNNHEMTTKISIPIKSETITEINDELTPAMPLLDYTYDYENNYDLSKDHSKTPTNEINKNTSIINDVATDSTQYTNHNLHQYTKLNSNNYQDHNIRGNANDSNNPAQVKEDQYNNANQNSNLNLNTFDNTRNGNPVDFKQDQYSGNTRNPVDLKEDQYVGYTHNGNPVDLKEDQYNSNTRNVNPLDLKQDEYSGNTRNPVDLKQDQYIGNTGNGNPVDLKQDQYIGNTRNGNPADLKQDQNSGNTYNGNPMDLKEDQYKNENANQNSNANSNKYREINLNAPIKIGNTGNGKNIDVTQVNVSFQNTNQYNNRINKAFSDSPIIERMKISNRGKNKFLDIYNQNNNHETKKNAYNTPIPGYELHTIVNMQEDVYEKRYNVSEGVVSIIEPKLPVKSISTTTEKTFPVYDYLDDNYEPATYNEEINYDYYARNDTNQNINAYNNLNNHSNQTTNNTNNDNTNQNINAYNNLNNYSNQAINTINYNAPATIIQATQNINNANKDGVNINYNSNHTTIKEDAIGRYNNINTDANIGYQNFAQIASNANANIPYENTAHYANTFTPNVNTVKANNLNAQSAYETNLEAYDYYDDVKYPEVIESTTKRATTTEMYEKILGILGITTRNPARGNKQYFVEVSMDSNEAKLQNENMSIASTEKMGEYLLEVTSEGGVNYSPINYEMREAIPEADKAHFKSATIEEYSTIKPNNLDETITNLPTSIEVPTEIVPKLTTEPIIITNFAQETITPSTITQKTLVSYANKGMDKDPPNTYFEAAVAQEGFLVNPFLEVPKVLLIANESIKTQPFKASTKEREEYPASFLGQEIYTKSPQLKETTLIQSTNISSEILTSSTIATTIHQAEHIETTTTSNYKKEFITTTNALYSTIQLQKFIQAVESNTNSLVIAKLEAGKNVEVTTLVPITTTVGNTESTLSGDTFRVTTDVSDEVNKKYARKEVISKKDNNIKEIDENKKEFKEIVGVAAKDDYKTKQSSGDVKSPHYEKAMDAVTSYYEKSSPTTEAAIKPNNSRSASSRSHRFGSYNRRKPERRKPTINEDIVDVIKSKEPLNKLNITKELLISNRNKNIEFNINAYTANLAYSGGSSGVTNPSFSKSANPTLAKAPKDYLNTTPINKSIRINVDQQQQNPNYIFNCFDRDINQFYSDPRDCRLFHYCTHGFTKTQLLDMKFVCDLGTFFDDAKLICTKAKPARCM